MRDVKKVLEMRSQNYSQRQISVSLKISRDTIRKIFNVADDKKVCWSSVKDLSESDVQNLLFEQEMKINDWVDCHIQAYRYFGGVTRLLIPDNLKVGIIQNKKYEDPILNKSYQEMAD